ncbi:UDP-glycosyltransferase 76E9 [Bienertia sinuspersici]
MMTLIEPLETMLIILGKFEIKESGSYMELQAFSVDTVQQFYRLWKDKLHYYYKISGSELTNKELLNYPPPDLRQDQWQYCVARFGSTEFKRKEQRLQHRLCRLLRKPGVKPHADVIWLVEHMTRNSEGEQLKVAIATHGDSMTQEEILLDVLKTKESRSYKKLMKKLQNNYKRLRKEHQNN